MRTTATLLNPFSLMMEPETVLRTMESSAALKGLRRRTLRPLDKPLIPFVNPPRDDAVDEPAPDAAPRRRARASLND